MFKKKVRERIKQAQFIDGDRISILLVLIKSGMPECAMGLLILLGIPMPLLLTHFPLSCTIK